MLFYVALIFSEVFSEMIRTAPAVWIWKFKKCLPKWQFGLQQSSGVGLDAPEVFNEISVWAQVWASMLQKWLLVPKWAPRQPQTRINKFIAAGGGVQNQALDTD